MANEEHDFEVPEGIDPEMIPFFAAAQEAEEDEEAPTEGATDVEDEEEADLDALRVIVRDTLLAGADPDLVDAVLAGELGDDEDGKQQ